MMLPSWLWRVLRSKRFRRGIAWSAFLVPAAIVLCYSCVNLLGKKVWEETMEELSQRGYPSTLMEAMGDAPSGRVDLMDFPAVLDEIRRIEKEDDFLTEIAFMKISGLKSEVSMGFLGEKAAPDPTVFFDEPLDASEAATKLLETLEPYEERRKGLVAIRADWSQYRSSREVGPNLFSFLNYVSAYLSDHAMVSAYARRGDLVVEDLDALLSWNSAYQNTGQSLMGSVIGLGMQNGLLDLIHEIVMSRCLDETDLERLLERLEKMNPEMLLTSGIRSEVSGMIEGHRQVMDAPPQVGWSEWFADWEYDFEVVKQKWGSLVQGLGPAGIHEKSYAGLVAGWAEEAELLSEDGSDWLELIRRYREKSNATDFDDEDLYCDFLSPPYSEQRWEWLSLPVAKTLTSRAKLQMTKAAVELELMRRANGKFPGSLGDVEKRDPLSEDAFGYRLERDGGYSIWSVGLDGIDDGGSGDDLVFRRWMRKP